MTMVVPFAFFIQIELTCGFDHCLQVGVICRFSLWIGVMMRQTWVSRHHRWARRSYRQLWKESIL